MHSVINENGKYICCEPYNMILAAVYKGKSKCEIAGYTIHILSHETDKEGNTITRVKVEKMEALS